MFEKVFKPLYFLLRINFDLTTKIASKFWKLNQKAMVFPYLSTYCFQKRFRFARIILEKFSFPISHQALVEKKKVFKPPLLLTTEKFRFNNQSCVEILKIQSKGKGFPILPTYRFPKKIQFGPYFFDFLQDVSFSTCSMGGFQVAGFLYPLLPTTQDFRFWPCFT